MRYMGGKSRIAKQLAAEINKIRRPGQLVWDAFCGGLSMSVALSEKGPVSSTDANVALIALYSAVKAGWQPPTEVGPDEYARAKTLPDTDPMKAFCGFGCSFGGKWFGGYAKGFNGPLTYPQLAARNVVRSVSKLQTFRVECFLSAQPEACDKVLYLDPPYAGTTQYSGAPPFDHSRFIDRVRDWGKLVPTFVSEYDFPIGELIWQRASRGTLGKTHGIPHVERLYYIGPTSWSEALRRAESGD